jgi:hypothetical protein
MPIAQSALIFVRTAFIMKCLEKSSAIKAEKDSHLIMIKEIASQSLLVRLDSIS